MTIRLLTICSGGLIDGLLDVDLLELREWVESLDGLVAHSGRDRSMRCY